MSLGYKHPVSVLVLIHTPALDVLLLERSRQPGLWQSVTGSLEAGESPAEAALRELAEETGLLLSASALHDWRQENQFEIWPIWRARYAPGVTHNLEHVFSVCVPDQQPITLSEHRAYQWLNWQAAAPQCFSWSNRDAVLQLPLRFTPATSV